MTILARLKLAALTLLLGAWGTVATAATPGVVTAWGNNSDGQTTIPGGLGSVVGISAGSFHSAALRANGSVVVWGANDYGQTTVPAGLSGVAAIAAGGYYTAALKSNGTVVAWGENFYGQTNIPPGLNGVTAIAAGDIHLVALKNDGTVVAWGADFSGQATVPSGLNGVTAITAGSSHTAALKQDGTVVVWGDNNLGQATVPTGLNGVIAIAAGSHHTVALRNDGTVVAWGYNNLGQATVPAGLTGVTAVAAGFYHTVALKDDGSVVAWGVTSGSDFHGQTTVPTGLSGVLGIAAGGLHTVALVTAGPDVAPTISLQPVSQTVNAGQIVNFTVTATGTEPLAYQWRQDGFNVTNATNAIYSVAAVQTSQAGAYTVVISNVAGAVTSAPPAMLTVIAPPAITAQPVDLTVNPGQPASFTVSATGTAPLTYQWSRDGFDLAGATNAVFNVAAAQTNQAGSYRVVVSNSAGSVTSAPPAVLTVRIAPAITIQPSGQTVNAGQAASFSVTATGTAPLAYQWSKDGLNLTRATNASFSVAGAQTNHAGNYTVVVSNAAGSVTSAPPAGLTVIVPPTITVQPVSQIVGLGRAASFSVTATGTPPLTYQWSKDGVNLGGATNATCNVPKAQTNHVGRYAVVVSNIAGYVTSAPPVVLLVVNAALSGTVVAWGDGSSGQTSVPMGLTEFIAIAAGFQHTVALKTDGRVVAWGANFAGETTVPTSLSGVTAIAVGGGALGGHTVALRSDGSVVAWGYNGYGQVTVPAGLTGVTTLAAGFLHTVALKNDGTVVAWGSDGFGQRTVPVGLSGVTAIAAGNYHTVALKSDGTVAAWGFNGFGQITIPAGLGDVVAIAAGGNHTLAVKRNGTVVAWGYNGTGQTSVPAGLAGVMAVAGGDGHSVALKSDGTVAAWGGNAYGQTSVPPGLNAVNAIGPAATTRWCSSRVPRWARC